MTMVSQNTAVMEINDWLVTEMVPEEPAAMAVVPIPASLVKRPLAIPKRAANRKVLPIKPPAAAFPVKALVKISDIVAPRKMRFCHNK